MGDNLSHVASLGEHLAMKMWKQSLPLDTLIRRDRLNRTRRVRRFLRFRLRTLLLLTTAVCLLSTVLHFRGTAMWAHAKVRMGQTLSSLPTTPVAEVVAVPFLLCSVLIGVPVFRFTHHLGPTKGCLLFATLCCIGLIALIAVVSLNSESLNKTEMRQFGPDEILRIVLLLVAYIPPVSALLGWYCAASDHRYQ